MLLLLVDQFPQNWRHCLSELRQISISPQGIRLLSLKIILSTYLITGANRGIGLELVRQLKDRGEDVIATCRSASPELNSLSVRVETNIDITSGESVIKLRENLNDTLRI